MADLVFEWVGVTQNCTLRMGWSWAYDVTSWLSLLFAFSLWCLQDLYVYLTKNAAKFPISGNIFKTIFYVLGSLWPQQLVIELTLIIRFWEGRSIFFFFVSPSSYKINTSNSIPIYSMVSNEIHMSLILDSFSNSLFLLHFEDKTNTSHTIWRGHIQIQITLHGLYQC